MNKLELCSTPYPKRIAQGQVVSVDSCDCGSFHVHVGALTLRLDVVMVRDLLATLGQAVAARAAKEFVALAGPAKKCGQA